MPRAQALAAKVLRFGVVPRTRDALATLAMDRRRRRAADAGTVIDASAGTTTEVQSYWSRHTVNSRPFATARGSRRYLEWRSAEYPLFREFSGLYGVHDGATVLDYGCGPGNDLVGFALHSRARHIVGADISDRALELASGRLLLHPEARGRVQLVRLDEGDERLPLEDGSVDFVSSQGVLHHASDPLPVLRELHRVLRPGGRGSVMVYNRDSVWLHLHIAWERQVRDGAWAGLSAAEAFSRSTDGEDCPIARSYHHAEWTSLCEQAGFETRYVGGYLSQLELRALGESYGRAIADERLAEEHRDFLRELSFDYAHRPMTGRWHAGVGGTYRLHKPA